MIEVAIDSEVVEDVDGTAALDLIEESFAGTDLCGEQVGGDVHLLTDIVEDGSELAETIVGWFHFCINKV